MFLDLMRDNAKTIPVTSNPLAVERARIWHCGYKTLAPLRSFKNLRALSIATFPDASLEVLSELTNLEDLRICHLPHVDELGPLKNLAKLRSLSLETLPSWDTSRKRTVVTSLEPLAEIPFLENLTLFGVVTLEGTLSALEKSKTLVTAKFQGYSKEEVARFFSVTGIRNEHNSAFYAG